jgi:hypothetical protein
MPASSIVDGKIAFLAQEQMLRPDDEAAKGVVGEMVILDIDSEFDRVLSSEIQTKARLLVCWCECDRQEASTHHAQLHLRLLLRPKDAEALVHADE